MSAPFSDLLALHGAELDASRDLAAALEQSLARSTVRPAFAPEPNAPRTERAAGPDVSAARAGLSIRSCVVRGRETTTGRELSILFRGRLASVDFVARQLLGTTEYEETPGPAPGGAEFLVLDHPLLVVLRSRQSGLCLPGWLRQRSTLANDWSETVRAFSPMLRKKISRALGTQCASASVLADPESKRTFYHRLYRPYVEHRFGASAVVQTERDFMRQTAESVLLTLSRDGSPVAAAVVARRLSTLFVGKAGYALDSRGAVDSDLLDYFCILLAQLVHCESIDWGLSRPHVEDGVFVNKSKWRPELVTGDGLLKSIRIIPLVENPATRAFFSRNGFVEQHNGTFLVRRLAMDNELLPGDPDAYRQLVRRSAIDRLVVATGSRQDPNPASGGQGDIGGGVEIRHLNAGPALQRRFLGVTL